MGQRLNTESDAVVMDVQIKFKMGEFALSMVQRLHPNYAALKDAQIIPDEEECA